MKRSKSYWVRRAAALEEALQNDADRVADEIVEAYEQAIENINADIHQTFTAYVATGIPDGEAEKLLNSAEHDEVYEELLRLYEETEDPVTKSEIANRINAQAYGARISRLEGIKARVYTQLVHVANIAEKKQRTLYTNSLQQAYYTNIYNIAEGLNCGIDFSLLPQRAIDKVLREPWHGKNYSDRIWIHNDRFINSVQDTITTGIISGHSVNRMAESLTEYVKEGNDIRSSTEALVRTETSHFMNQGQLQAYEDIGIEKYRFVAALADNTCERCASLDGAVFERDKAVEGKNYPPLHPRCRCVTIMADAVPSTRIARDPLTGKNYKVDGSMTFAEWKDSLSDEQRAMLKYVDKSAGSGIIKTGSMATQDDAIKWLLRGKNISSEQFKELKNYAKNKGVILSGFKKSDVDIDLIKEVIDDAEILLKQHPELRGAGRKQFTLELSYHMRSNDFAMATPSATHIIKLNGNAFRNKAKLEEEYAKLERCGWFVKGTNYRSIVKHEFGHIYEAVHKIDSLKIAKEITGIENKTKLMEYLETNVSEYAGSFDNGAEIISEVFADIYSNDKPTEFAVEFFRRCSK